MVIGTALPMAIRRRWPWLALAPVVSGCDLSNVSVPEGEEIIVVHAVMRPDRAQQWILVERSLTGDVLVLDDTTDVPPDNPRRPLNNATVTVSNLSQPEDPCGGAVAFTAARPGGAVVPGLYWSPTRCPTMAAGDSLRLQVTGPSGRVVVGTTVVPRIVRATARTADDSVPIGPTILSFNRDRDTIRVVVEGTAGRALQVSIRTLNADSSSGIPTSFVVDTTDVTLPGTLVTLADSSRGGDAFRAGRMHLLAVAYTDRHYFDFARTANGPITGRGFIGNLEGGIGVFGSLTTRTMGVRVVGDVDRTEEGAYDMQGTVNSLPIDLDWELYVNDETEDGMITSAYVSGNWVSGPIDTSVDGSIRPSFGGDRIFDSTIGSLGGAAGPDLRLLGVYEASGPFTVTVTDTTGARVGELVATKR